MLCSGIWWRRVGCRRVDLGRRLVRGRHFGWRLIGGRLWRGLVGRWLAGKIRGGLRRWGLEAIGRRLWGYE